MNRVYGPQAARRVVWVGFGVGVACSLIGTQIMGEFGPLVTLRIALGSGIAFLTAQLIDVAIFDRLREDKARGRMVARAAGPLRLSAPRWILPYFSASRFLPLLCFWNPAMTCHGPVNICRCWVLARNCRCGRRWRWLTGPSNCRWRCLRWCPSA